MIGTIQAARKSKSGQTLSIQIEGVWYTSKNWELEQAVNRRVIFEPSVQSFPDGGSCTWLNDYVFEDAQTTPAAAAMNAAMASHDTQAMQQGAPTPPVAAYEPPGAPQTANKDSVIGAMALCKCCVPGTPEQVFSNFVFLYNKLNSWDSSTPF